MRSRRTNAELEVEFDRLVAQIEAFEVLFGPLVSPETAPHVVARRIKATAGLSVAIQGCKVAINDALEIALDAPHEQQALVDARLVQAGAPRLHVLLAGRAKSIVAILKRGAVKTDTEFYLLKEALINESAPLSSNRRKRAQLMLAAYEDSSRGAV
jgi:hypothetical protein